MPCGGLTSARARTRELKQMVSLAPSVEAKAKTSEARAAEVRNSPPTGTGRRDRDPASPARSSSRSPAVRSSGRWGTTTSICLSSWASRWRASSALSTPGMMHTAAWNSNTRLATTSAPHGTASESMSVLKRLPRSSTTPARIAWRPGPRQSVSQSPQGPRRPRALHPPGARPC